MLYRLHAQHLQPYTASCSLLLCYCTPAASRYAGLPMLGFSAIGWRCLIFRSCTASQLSYISCAVPRCVVSCCLQLGVLVQHREACRSALCFLSRLLDPGTALSKLRDQQQQRQTFAGTAIDTSAASMALLQSQLDRVGANLTRVLMGAVVGALPYSRVADISPVVQVRGSACVSGWVVKDTAWIACMLTA